MPLSSDHGLQETGRHAGIRSPQIRGAPMVLLVNIGLLFAPAAHGGALFPGVMPLMVAILAKAMLNEAFTPPKTVGLALIVTGAILIASIAGGSLGTRQNIGHALFLAA